MTAVRAELRLIRDPRHVSGPLFTDVYRLGMIDIEGSRRVTDVLQMLLGH